MKATEATLTRRPNPLDSRDTGTGVLKTALRGLSPPRGSSPGLGDGPRGECPGLRSVSFWPGNFQRVEKVHKLSPRCPHLLLRPFSVPTHPPIEPEDEHRVYFRRAGLPRPLCPLSWQKESQRYKGGQGQGLASSRHEVSRRALEKEAA